MNLRILRRVGPSAALALGIVALWLHPADEYFFGDSISTLLTRSLSWRAAVLDFFRLGGTHWYRPLTNGFVQAVTWPLFGMNFTAYHWLAMFLHWCVCLALFYCLRIFLKDHVAAFIGAAFYAFHPIQFYATYDVCFYQEPIGGGLILGAVAFLYWYAERGGTRYLIAGLLFFVAAITARETAVFTQGLLAILLFPPKNWRRAATAVGITGIGGAAFAGLYLFVMHPLRHQPADYSSDWSPAHLATNLWTCARWSFGIAAGTQTDGWRSPAIITALLWCVAAAVMAGSVLLWRREPAVWKGPAFFCAASIAALSTHRLWPHHLYLPLMGTALWIGAVIAGWRRTQVASRVIVPAAGALLACVAATSAIGARNDSVDSWVGRDSWVTRQPIEYSRALFRDLPRWRGVWVVVKTGDPSFSWLYGGLFRLMSGDHEFALETRLMSTRPDSAPEGVHVFEYRDSMLWPLAIPASHEITPAAINLTVTPERVHPGMSYTVAIPALAGRTIDLRYRYNDHLPEVAYEFTNLDTAGTAKIFTPPDTPWGDVEIIGVRLSGAAEWSPVRVRVQVLRD